MRSLLTDGPQRLLLGSLWLLLGSIALLIAHQVYEPPPVEEEVSADADAIADAEEPVVEEKEAAEEPVEKKPAKKITKKKPAKKKPDGQDEL